MSPRKTLFSLPLLLLAACAAELGSGEGDSDLGKADDNRSTTAPQFVVFRNTTDCFRAPCPIYTYIDATGNVGTVADVVLPEGNDEDFAALSTTGLEVEGVIVLGSWSVGPGDVLHVDQITGHIGQAALFMNGITCFAAPCPSWTILEENGEHSQVAGIDLSALKLSEASIDSMLNDMAAGLVLVGGFVRPGSWEVNGPGDVFVVTTVSGIMNDDFSIEASGVVCATFPCPSYAATKANGDREMFDSINFAALELGDSEMQRVQDALKNGEIVQVRGFARVLNTQVSGAKAQQHTLQVTKLLRFE
jgi:hypothetical protein